MPNRPSSFRYPSNHLIERSRQRRLNSVRDKSFYKSAKWRKARLVVLANQPICATAGCEQLATDVDHIRPIAQGGQRFDLENLQALCRSCHSRKTASETLGGGPISGA